MANALRTAVIEKHLDRFTPRPNLPDDDAFRGSYSWEQARGELEPLAGGAINISHECVDRHARETPERVAVRWRGRHGDQVDLTYGGLRDATSRFANALDRLGVGRGERVFALTGRVPELYTTVLGTLKHGSAACTLFSAFGPEPIRQRLELGDARVLVTTSALYRRKVHAIRHTLPRLRHVIVIDDEGKEPREDVLHLGALLASAEPSYQTAPTKPTDMALLHFTSGTTGTPKAAIHVHEAIASHRATARWALDLHDDDVFWCTADPGWVTGMSYGMLAPLALGVTSVVDEGDFDATRWYELLQKERVSVWYTAPTAIRMMMRAGADLAREHPCPDLRFIASVGEPLNPEAVWWGLDAFGLPIHDNWWQTETGGIMIANLAAMDIKPGSMGKPLPGVEVAILRRDDNGEVVTAGGKVEELHGAKAEGELALRPGWPSMFRGYLNDPARTSKCFVDGWYLSGDLARRDDDGYIWFVGRGDDVIKSAGHLIGPFEVESVLMEHPAVAEAGVIGKPDPVVGEVVKAFVTLKPGVQESEELRLELIGFGRTHLGAAVAPKEIAFKEHLPKTRSGKIVRRLLRARELGLPEGDLSTLEEQ